MIGCVWQETIEFEGMQQADLFRPSSFRTGSVALLQGTNRKIWEVNKKRAEEDPQCKLYDYCCFKSVAFVEYRDVFKCISQKLRVFRFVLFVDE